MKSNSGKSILKVLFFIFIILFIAAIVGYFILENYYTSNLEPVYTEGEAFIFTIEEGEYASDVSAKLYEQGLIKNENVFNFYVSLEDRGNFMAGDFLLAPTMSVEEITSKFIEGDFYVVDILITIPEGKSLEHIADILASQTIRTSEEYLETWQDPDFLNQVIEDFWFIDETILDDDLRYALEGYLFPETYYFYIEGSVKSATYTMLNQMEKVLDEYESGISSSSYNVHELLTLASIIELEGVSNSSRSMISGVFYNRLNNGMELGSDVTTYYGLGIDLTDGPLTKTQFNTYTPYNTRNSNVIGLPVGAICNPGKSSIEAAIYPTANDNYFFVADINMETYFRQTYDEHLLLIQQLKDDGLWPE